VAIRKSYMEDGVLYCFYPEGTCMFDDVITAAYEAHNIEPGACQVICRPFENRCKHGLTAQTCFYCRGGEPTKDNGTSPNWLKG
jgi:hypothetical protein